MESEAARAALPRGLVVLLAMAAAVVVIGGLRATSDLFGPTFLALVLTILAHPLRRWLDRALPSWAASAVCIVVVYVLVIGLALAVLVSTARFAALLPTYQNTFDDRVDDVVSWLDGLGVDQAQLQSIASSFDLSQLGGIVESLLAGALGALSSLVFALALVLFMTMDGGSFPRQLAAVARVRPGLVEGMTGFARGTRRYLAVSTIFGLIVAVLDTVALAILDVPAPLLWGLLAFITNYIPNIGFVIGLVPPAVLALLEGGFGLMLTVIAVYCLLNVVIQSVIQPKFVGDAVGLSTTLTFVSLVFWAWVLGPLGALMAVPLSLLAKALLVDVDPSASWLRPLLSNKDDPAPGLSPGS